MTAVEPHRLLVTGSRDWADRRAVARELLAASEGIDPGQIVVVHGGAMGADYIADEIADAMGWRAEAHVADWRRHGRKAGPLRNAQMVELGAAVCLCFALPCAKPGCPVAGPHDSHGASGCADLAEATGIDTRRFRP